MFGCILQWFIKGQTSNHLDFIQSFNQGETKTQNRNNMSGNLKYTPKKQQKCPHQVMLSPHEYHI
jgi:hypothetical protein